MRERTPWMRLVASAALHGIEPACFWRLSVKEWRALMGGRAEVMTRAAFEALAQRFPDLTS